MISPFNAGCFVKQAVKFAAALLLVTTPALGQEVGYPPAKSPYRDLVWSQHLTVFGGYYRAGKDAVGAAPGSAPMLGLRYEVDIAGPAQFWGRIARVGSERNAYNPTLPTATRSLGKFSDPLYLADVGFSFNLTGRKSWHRIVPVLGFGIGIASATKKVPNDPYQFGTQFSFSTEAGVRIVPSDRYELRLMMGNSFYRNHYPDAYTVNASDTTAVLGSGVSRSSYLSNLALTAGVSIPLFR